MVLFSNQNPDLGKFWKALDWKKIDIFLAICNILRTSGIFFDHLVHFVSMWYIFFSFGIMDQETSGNPDGKNGGKRFFLKTQIFSFSILSIIRTRMHVMNKTKNVKIAFDPKIARYLPFQLFLVFFTLTKY
jgi:hypothetical protein